MTDTAAGRPGKAADSPRWCERCQKYGDHHTDRHDECAPATAACARRAGLAVQCRKDNEAEVNAFLREVRGLSLGRHYRPNPHGAWQGIYDGHGMVEQVWVGSWLVSLPESPPYLNLSDGLFRELYEVPDAE